MSISTQYLSEVGTEDEVMRAEKLAAARKKLKTFRATRSSKQSSTTSTTSFPSTSSISPLPLPLTTDIGGNYAAPPRSPSKPKSKDLELAPPPKSPQKLRKSRSKGSMNSHRRQPSSISGPSGGSLARGSVLSLFDCEDEHKPMRAVLPGPSDIITTPATPLMDAPNLVDESTKEEEEEDVSAVKNGLSAFSFGAKPPSNPRSPSPRSRTQSALLPSQLSHPEAFASPSSSPSRRLSTPLSRPPSLLLTRPTPMAFGTPSNPSSSSHIPETPQTPPTPARTRRHSHTRSNSISLPNLKLASRPISLGIPSSPSFPSSPSSPIGGGRLSAPMQGTRLKFEPSGRGAEADKEKEEYRRRALEKLTGSSSPTLHDSPGHEISLPDLDDEDTSSTASSSRPYSGIGAFSFGGRPSSSSSAPSGFSWSANEDSPPLDRWSGFSHKSDDKDEAFDFGFSLGGPVAAFSFNSLTTSTSLDTGLGMGLPSTMSKRPSLTRNLSVLAEVDEPEDGEVDADTDVMEQLATRSPALASLPLSPEITDGETDVDEEDTATYVPIIAPTPSRLRELHLVSSVSSTPSSVPRPSSVTTPTAPGSPTKVYGAIGRGRPHPNLPGHSFQSDSPSTATTLISTPKSGGSRRRAAPGSGSRGSSISYRKDDSSSSSRDWSMSSIKVPFSPPTSLGDVASPSPAFSPRFMGWGNVPKATSSRPCPRPKSLAGLGNDNAASGRILGEVEEEEEDNTGMGTEGRTSFRFRQQDEVIERESSEYSRDNKRDSFASLSWRDPQLELEMERDALKEDVEMWRKRYAAIEDRLESEKKESGVLRERVRKLGDRLSSVSSYPNLRNSEDVTLIADLRNQLFSVTSQLERERRERQAAVDQIHQLESRLQQYHNQQTFKPTLPSLALSVANSDFQTHVISPTPLSPEPSYVESDSSTLDNSPDPNFNRMKSWGFPRSPPAGMATQARSRESFFGLSQVLRRDSVEEERGEPGFDLPPFAFSGFGTAAAQITRVVSEPVQSTEREVEAVEPRSTSLTSSASTAFSYFASYLKGSTSNSPPRPRQTQRSSSSTSSLTPTGRGNHRLGGEGVGGQLDFRKGCKCCTGEVLEL